MDPLFDPTPAAGDAWKDFKFYYCLVSTRVISELGFIFPGAFSTLCV